MNATIRLLFATAVLVLSATSASSSSQMAGTTLIGPGAPASPSVTALNVADTSKRVQFVGSMAVDRGRGGSNDTANGGVAPMKVKDGRFWSAFWGDSSTEPPAYSIPLALFVLVVFLVARRRPD